MDDELDYMSDDFITSCVGSGESDVRPGLLKSRKEQREHELMKKKAAAAALVPQKVSAEIRQAEALEEGLKQPISSTNKGFSMLQKMGFKDGMGLGKNNTGIVEPIAINIKNNKKGLGLKTEPKIPPKKKNVENKLDQFSEKDFMAFHSKKDREKKVNIDLGKSQRICKELDLKNDRNKPVEMWYWPNEPENNGKEDTSDDEDEDENEDKQELSNDIKLDMLTRYLRQTYFYCIWCTVQYEDEKDMNECPGTTREDH